MKLMTTINFAKQNYKTLLYYINHTRCVVAYQNNYVKL